MKYTFTIKIPLDTDWPNGEMLEKRDQLEDQLLAYEHLSIIEVGAGLGNLEIVIETNYQRKSKNLILSELQKLQLENLAVIEIVKNQNSQVKVVPGDLFTIPLQTNLYAVGIVLHVSKVFKDGIMVGLYEQSFQSIVNFKPEHINSEFIDVPNYTSKKLIHNDIWPKIGHNQQLLLGAEIPYLAASFSLYFKDELIKQLTSIEEYKQYTELESAGRYFIENKLADHFKAA